MIKVDFDLGEGHLSLDQLVKGGRVVVHYHVQVLSSFIFEKKVLVHFDDERVLHHFHDL